ncbi:uncharacterized protein LOC132199802 isoform X2 [Neocloeon triangulifer]|uniref:uncharacterized protein LOC132199802 isoform X2 n=1 Tax=Neocloeon triangulifer TaxID=2078957 RepID=UPI00286EC32A|nr:uncharacterized protein LOC132199802 isoform X2 [Neocloeon triangulifer]
MAEQGTGGHGNGGQTDGGGHQGLDEKSAAAICSNRPAEVEFYYRVTISKLPLELSEDEILKLVHSVSPTWPRFQKFMVVNRGGRYEGADMTNSTKILTLEFDQEESANALFEKLHETAPYFFEVKVSKRDPRFVYKPKRGGYNNNSNRGGYGNSQALHFNGNLKQNGFRDNYNSNFRGGYARSPVQMKYFRPREPPLLMTPEESAEPAYNGSSHMFPQFPGHFAAGFAMGGSTLVSMSVGQNCAGCGSVTQSNCAVCFTPFCTPYCMAKLTNPTHPFECHTLLVNTCPADEMQNIPSYDSWNQQCQTIDDQNRRGGFSNRRPLEGNYRHNYADQQQRNPCPSVTCNNESETSLEDSLKNLNLQGTMKTPPPKVVEKQASPPVDETQNTPNGASRNQQCQTTRPPKVEVKNQQPAVACPPQAAKQLVEKGPAKNLSWSPQAQLQVTPPKFVVPPGTPEQTFVRHTAPPLMFNKMVPPPVQTAPMGPMMPSPSMMAPLMPPGPFNYVLVPSNHQMLLQQQQVQHYFDPLMQQFYIPDQFDLQNQQQQPTGPLMTQHPFFLTNYQGYM